MDFHPGGRLFTSGSLSASALWDWQTGERIAALPKAYLRASVFHQPTGDLITIGRNGVLRWPIQTESQSVQVGPPQTLWPPASNMMDGAISATGKPLAFVLDGEGGVVLDPDHPSAYWRMTGHDNMSYVAISPDDRWIATSTSLGGEDVVIWDTITRRRAYRLPAARTTTQAAFSPDGHWLVTSAAAHIRWRVGTWEALGRITRTEEAPAMAGPIAFSPDSTLVAVADRPHVIALIDVSSWKTVALLEHRAKRTLIYLTFSPDGAHLLASPEGRDDILVWDLRTIRDELSKLDLDWNMPAYPSEALSLSGN